MASEIFERHWPEHAAGLVPVLRLVARSFVPTDGAADALVARTLETALAQAAALPPGRTAAGWLYVILRDLALAQPAAPATAPDGWPASIAGLTRPASAQGPVMTAIRRLDLADRQPLLLLALLNLPEDEAAAICGCPVAEVVARARSARDLLQSGLDKDVPGAFAAAGH